MKILVTGGAGFVGGNLCGRLLEMGFYVICVDNLYSGKFENIEKFIKNPDFLFINKDVRDFIDLECDWIFNLASPASPVKYQADAVFTFMTNILGTFNMLELARKNNARIFQASTSEIYGNPGVHPQCESYFGNVNTIGVRSCYNEGKRGSETLFYDYNRKYGVDIRVARIFNTYGPGMYPEDGRIISNFIYQALNNYDLTVYGDGSHTRSLGYIDDIIDGIIALMESDYIYPVNLGNPAEYSVNQIADIIIKKTESDSKIVNQKLPSDDPVRRKPDISIACKILNWEPKIELQQGLDKTIEYFKKIM